MKFRRGDIVQKNPSYGLKWRWMISLGKVGAGGGGGFLCIDDHNIGTSVFYSIHFKEFDIKLDIIKTIRVSKPENKKIVEDILDTYEQFERTNKNHKSEGFTKHRYHFTKKTIKALDEL